MQTPQTLTITRPDDWHLHLRDGAAMAAVLPHTSAQFARAIIMPNLKPPIRTVVEAIQYYERIMAAVPNGHAFEPLMTLYLTDNTTPDEIALAAKSSVVKAVKYYPAGATTNSDSGVTDISKCDAVLAAMEAADLPLLLHGEVTSDSVDVFDRERIFIDTQLVQIVKKFPQLRIVLEHITTSEAVQFVESASNNVAATITPQHLLLSRNAIFKGGIRPHFYCLPILKRESHRVALSAAATSGNPKFFLGTDSAPHTKNSKESCCGAAGCYSSLHAMPLYAEAFESVNALDKLEAFASFYGPDFYRLPRNQSTITLKKIAWTVPEDIPFIDTVLVPLRAGETMQWQLA